MKRSPARAARTLSRATRSTGRASFALATGISRHGVMAAERVVSHTTTRRLSQRALSLATGSALIGLGVALFARARFGLPPYDVMLSVLRDLFSVSLGQAGWALALVLLTAAAVLGQLPRLGTLLYILLNGVTVDAAIGLVRTPDTLVIRVAFVAFGITAIAAGVSLVVHSGNPGGAFELLMRAGAQRGHDPMRVRTALEVSLLVTGVAAGGDFGPATVVFALAIGPIMRAGRQALEDHQAGRRHRVGALPPPERLTAGASASS